MRLQPLKQSLLARGRRLRAVAEQLAALIGLRAGFVFAGIALVSNGLSMVYPPAAWIFAGLALLWLGAR